MRLCVRHKTDEEFVETVRRRISGPETSRGFHVRRILLLVLTLVLLCKLSAWLPSHASMTEGRMWQAVSVADGTVIGWMLCLATYNVIWMVRACRGLREERLMIRFHD